MVNIEQLKELQPFTHAINRFDGFVDFKNGWENCKSGDYLLDMASLIRVDHCEIAKTKYLLLQEILPIVKSQFMLDIAELVNRRSQDSIERGRIDECLAEVYQFIRQDFGQYNALTYAHKAIYLAVSNNYNYVESLIVDLVGRSLAYSKNVASSHGEKTMPALSDLCRDSLKTVVYGKLEAVNFNISASVASL